MNIREPARDIGRIVAALVGGSVVLTAAILGLLAAFGVTLNEVQVGAILTLVGVLAGIIGPLVGASEIRQRTTPVAAPVLRPGQEVTVWDGEAGHTVSVTTLSQPSGTTDTPGVTG